MEDDGASGGWKDVERQEQEMVQRQEQDMDSAYVLCCEEAEEHACTLRELSRPYRSPTYSSDEEPATFVCGICYGPGDIRHPCGIDYCESCYDDSLFGDF